MPDTDNEHFPFDLRLPWYGDEEAPDDFDRSRKRHQR
jgi:hypothetical protein